MTTAYHFLLDLTQFTAKKRELLGVGLVQFFKVTRDVPKAKVRRKSASMRDF